MKQIGRGEHRRITSDWLGPSVTVLVGTAYLLGYLETTFFASALGVTTRDLDLGVRDYGVLALLNLAVLGVVVGAWWVQDLLDLRDNPRIKRWVEAAGSTFERRSRRVLAEVSSVLAISITTAVGIAGFGVSVAALIPIAATCLLGLRLLTSLTWRSPLAYALLASALAGVVAVSGWSAHEYARRLQADAEANVSDVRLPPLPLRAVLQPELGVVVSSGTVTCGVRVASRVVLGQDAVTVTTVDRFTVRRCDIARVPFE